MRINQNMSMMNAQLKQMSNQPKKTEQYAGEDVKSVILEKMHSLGVTPGESSIENVDQAASMTARIQDSIASNVEAAFSAQANVNAEFAKSIL